jgi:hypothetical protein
MSESMINGQLVTLFGVVGKTAVVHTLTYFVVGLIAMYLFRYPQRLADPALSSFMRQTNDPLVQAGILFQPLRGALFGLVFYLLRDVLFRQANGWAVMWVALVVIGVVSTFAPAPGSIEGLVYAKFSAFRVSGGLLEVLSQSLLLSVITCYWVSHPEKIWVTRVLVALCAVAVVLPALGLLARLAGARRFASTKS